MNRPSIVRFIPAVVKAPTPPIKDATAPLPEEEYDEPVRTEPKRRAGERLQAMAEMAERAKKYNASSYAGSSSFSDSQKSSNQTSKIDKSDCSKSCKHCGGVSSSSKRKQTPLYDSDKTDSDDDDEKLNAILKKLKLSSHSRNSL